MRRAVLTRKSPRCPCCSAVCRVSEKFPQERCPEKLSRNQDIVSKACLRASQAQAARDAKKLAMSARPPALNSRVHPGGKDDWSDQTYHANRIEGLYILITLSKSLYALVFSLSFSKLLFLALPDAVHLQLT